MRSARNSRVVFTILAVLFLASCGDGDGEQEAPEASAALSSETQHQSSNELVIAEQYGLAYAPLQVMRAEGFLEAELPDYEIEWSRLGNTAAIREAIDAQCEGKGQYQCHRSINCEFLSMAIIHRIYASSQ